MSQQPIALTQALMQRRSISPQDAGCQQLICEILQPLGFVIEPMPFGETANLWAYHGAQNAPTLLFAGHTDVVPPGDESQWHYPPFAATLDENGILHGRGAADMKSGIAAMVCAAAEFVQQHQNHPGRIALLITSDEEADALDGTVKVVEQLQQRQERVDFCIVGEPSSNQQLGDQIKNGRRGSLTANLTVHGIQGHVAYPQLADNPVHRFAGALLQLVNTEWDHGNDYFPKTTMQVANMHAGTGAENVIPGDLQVQFNFRYSSELTHTQIQQRVTAILDQHQLRYTLNWRHSGEPFLTPQGKLTAVATDVIKTVTGIQTELSTSGGTSDGRFIAKLGCQLIELGVCNATIHKVNEQVAAKDIEKLYQIYLQITEKLLLA